MIGWIEIYNVVVAMAPLYVALILGYGSVCWWKIFTHDQCDAVNRLVCYFTLPLFTFDFTSHIDPFRMNYLFIGGDAISRLGIVVVLVFWLKFCSKQGGSYAWSITIFSLSTMTNTLVVGVPLLKAMYGKAGVDLVVQSTVVQSIIWITLLLFVLEIRRSGSIEVVDSHTLPGETLADLERNEATISTRPPFWSLMKKVWIKLAMNPNYSYACILGVAWAFVAARWHIEMPSIMEESILIMSKAGTGTAMFSMGMFMAQQEKLIACGASLTLLGMVLKFIAGPASMAVGAFAVGLRGDILSIAIIQAALPQAIVSFIFAKEYDLHAEVLSTAVIFGTIVSLPVLIVYYIVLELLN